MLNRLLIAILDVINKLLALFLILSSTAAGYYGNAWPYIGEGYVEPRSILGAVIGFLVGLALAGIFSGFLAAIITIARELTALRELMAVRVLTPPPP
ncbi:MAG TPA: hypothetical protein VF502_06520 [Stellaceae bacterium]